MLKYAIIFYLICYGNGIRGRVGIYNGLILVQHSPVTSFYWQHMNNENDSIGVEEFDRHVTVNGLTIAANKWVIYGLWAIDSNYHKLEDCVTASGLQPCYKTEDLTNETKQELKNIWPILKSNGTQEDLWAEEYKKYGACVSNIPSLYFYSAVSVYHAYDLGGILGRSGILPGRKYPLDLISVVLRFALGEQVYLKCLPAQNREDQYLLQIQLCFTPLHHLTKCRHREEYASNVHECSKERNVIYPDIPTVEQL